MSRNEQDSGDSRRIWEALAFILHRVYEPLEDEEADWAIIGSAASALQDIAVTPNELRILSSPETLDTWSRHLWDWLDEESDNQDPDHVKLTLTVEHAPVTILVREPRESEQGILLEGVGRRRMGRCRQSAFSELARAGGAARSAIRNRGGADGTQSITGILAAVSR